VQHHDLAAQIGGLQRAARQVEPLGRRPAWHAAPARSKAEHRRAHRRIAENTKSLSLRAVCHWKQASAACLPTMRAYGLQGTPSLILLDRHGDLRLHAFGAVEDMALGAAIAALIGERG
jgi:hypothetical protein